MFENISLRSVASYSNQLNTAFQPKKINLIYGHNGTGKSTIARFLQSPTDSDYAHCQTTNNFPQSETFVYNEVFIESNFFESTPGVFTLSEANQIAETEITNAQSEIGKLSPKIATLNASSFKAQNDIEPLQTALKEKIWTEKINFERTSLDYCLIGFKGGKDVFFQQVIASTTSVTDTDTFESLMLDATELIKQKALNPKPIPKSITPTFSGIESNSVFSEVIVGSEDSYLSQLIAELSNSDWVKLGIPYINNSKSDCPFCQQNLPATFEADINALFNDVYNNKINAITSLLSEYEDEKTTLKDLFSDASFDDDYFAGDIQFQSTKSTLFQTIDANLIVIKTKKDNPSKPVVLTSTSESIQAVNNAIEAIKARIQAFNLKIANRETHLNNIKNKFWALVKKKYLTDIESTNKAVNALKISCNSFKDEILLLQNIVGGYDRVVAENRAKTTNIDMSVSNINKYMTMLGLEGFRIERELPDSNFYHLVRSNSKKIYKTLSEGEKTLITFLYFIEVCKGSANQSSSVLYSNRIVVIDDPVTSLSHNYVYDIAALIQHKIIEAGFRQVFVLTHSLFFLHEMIKLKDYCDDKPLKQSYALYRVTKNQTSSISVITDKEIMNDYQSYWQIIKDCKNGKANPLVLPNMMRNVLEYYFAFVHQKKNLTKILDKLGEEELEFRPLSRYINRQSHADDMNIHDFGQIDPARYLVALEKIFTNAHFKEHYELMMAESPVTL